MRREVSRLSIKISAIARAMLLRASPKLRAFADGGEGRG
jgi:hypothetical protein